MNEWYWLSTNRMTVAVAVRDGKIVVAAPIVARFIGQSPENLGRWLRGQGGFRAKKMSNDN